MWRVVEKDETDLLAEASRFERSFPRFYRDASETWTIDEDAVLDLYRSCIYIYGIFQRGLIGLLYFQRVNDTHHVVHLDAKRGADPKILLNAFCGVRDDRFANETLSCETWVLRRNRPLQMMLRAAAFNWTGLQMRTGKSHGKVLRWVQMKVVRGD